MEKPASKMNGKINPRVFLWLIILVTLAAVFYLPNKQVKIKPAPQKPTVTKDFIRTDFLDLSRMPVPVKPVLGGHFQANEILFPRDFKGEQGNIFYVEMEDGHIAATVKYEISTINNKMPPQVQYKALQSYEPGQIDPRQFDAVPIVRQQIESTGTEGQNP